DLEGVHLRRGSQRGRGGSTRRSIMIAHGSRVVRPLLVRTRSGVGHFASGAYRGGRSPSPREHRARLALLHGARTPVRAAPFRGPRAPVRAAPFRGPRAPAVRRVPRTPVARAPV